MQDTDKIMATAADIPADVKSDTAPESEWKDFGKFLLKLAIFMMILRSFIVSPFNIPSESMQPRLLIGDYLLVAKWPYGYSKHSMVFGLPIIPGKIFASLPKRGDVVVFKAPPTQRDDYIKRVIGLPGDQIQMRNGILFINDVAVKKERIADLVIPVTQNMKDAVLLESAQNGSSPQPCFRPEFEEAAKSGGTQCRYPRYRETLPEGKSYEILDLGFGFVDGSTGIDADNTPAYVIPEGQIFAMGDNRDRSSDSRFPAQEGRAVGLIPTENLVGRALITVFSTDGSSSWLLPWTWFSAARWDRVGESF
jgi:signal peptidase I